MNSDHLGAGVVACAAAHRAVIADIAALTEDQARQPSLLPGWTIGHVLTHLARNADGFSRIVEGAERGEAVAMYD
ncbi:MAG: maleylpyruvate isomerase N-terminal domain-containing protein, partial [Gaiellaceae bacterium]